VEVAVAVALILKDSKELMIVQTPEVIIIVVL